MANKNNANKNNAKVNENRKALALTLSKGSTLSLYSDMLTSKHNTIEEFNGKESEVFKFTVNKGQEVTTITVRESASVTALTNIEKLSRLANASASVICSEMRKIPNSTIEKSGLSALNFFKGAFNDVLSDNTISRYYRISRLFFDPNTFAFRNGLDCDVAISNLDAVLPLFKFKERNLKVEELTEKELLAEYNAFFEEYILKDTIHLFKSQTQLKEEVKKASKGIIDNKATSESGNSSDKATSESGNSSDITNSDNSAATSNNFDKIAESIAIIRQLLDDEEIKAKFDDVVAYIEETLA